MLELFDPPINEIIELVESQVQSAQLKGEKIHVAASSVLKFNLANSSSKSSLWAASGIPLTSI
jgi:hypothetical protein